MAFIRLDLPQIVDSLSPQEMQEMYDLIGMRRQKLGDILHFHPVFDNESMIQYCKRVHAVFRNDSLFDLRCAYKYFKGE